MAATRELAGLTDAALDAVAACNQRTADVVRIARTVRTPGPTLVRRARPPRCGRRRSSGRRRVGPFVIHLLQELSPAAGELLQALAQRQPSTSTLGWLAIPTPTAGAGGPCPGRHFVRSGTRGPAGRLGRGQRERPRRGGAPRHPPGDGLDAFRCSSGPGGRPVRGRRSLRPFAARAAGGGGFAPPGRAVAASAKCCWAARCGLCWRCPIAASAARTCWLRYWGAAPPRGRWRPAGPGAHFGAAGVVDGVDWELRLAVFAADGAPGRTRPNATGRKAGPRICAATPIGPNSSRPSWPASDDPDRRLRRVLGGYGGAAHGLLSRYLGGNATVALAGGGTAGRRTSRGVLDRLAGLDTVGGPPPSVEVFRRALDGELEVSLPWSGHFGDGVLVGPVSLAIGLELDRIVCWAWPKGLSAATVGGFFAARRRTAGRRWRAGVARRSGPRRPPAPAGRGSGRGRNDLFFPRGTCAGKATGRRRAGCWRMRPPGDRTPIFTEDLRA